MNRLCWLQAWLDPGVQKCISSVLHQQDSVFSSSLYSASTCVGFILRQVLFTWWRQELQAYVTHQLAIPAGDRVFFSSSFTQSAGTDFIAPTGKICPPEPVTVAGERGRGGNGIFWSARFWVMCPVPQRKIRKWIVAGAKERHHSEELKDRGLILTLPLVSKSPGHSGPSSIKGTVTPIQMPITTSPGKTLFSFSIPLV